jgi:hypothetical protein
VHAVRTCLRPSNHLRVLLCVIQLPLYFLASPPVARLTCPHSCRVRPLFNVRTHNLSCVHSVHWCAVSASGTLSLPPTSSLLLACYHCPSQMIFALHASSPCPVRRRLHPSCVTTAPHAPIRAPHETHHPLRAHPAICSSFASLTSVFTFCTSSPPCKHPFRSLR